SILDHPKLYASRRRRYSTQTILIATALGAAIGIILVPVNFALVGLTTTFPVIASISLGPWGMAALLPLAVLRRGGSGIIGGTAAGIVLVVSPGALLMVVVMAIWGMVMEIPFFVTRYRWFGWTMFTVVGVIAGVISCVASIYTYNLPSMNAGLVTLICVAQISSFVVGSLLSLVISRALARAGIAGGHRRVAR
ncbi:MAG: ECF transporter S component, partial [Paraburkholderia sp.]|uniref:ECF transporter S component n=1 Tax=Paraburkholderia sp. TaxID=1926495 RepID=UPI003C657FA2